MDIIKEGTLHCCTAQTLKIEDSNILGVSTVQLRFPYSEQSVLTECGQEVLVRMVGQSYHVLLVDLRRHYIKYCSYIIISLNLHSASSPVCPWWWRSSRG